MLTSANASGAAPCRASIPDKRLKRNKRKFSCTSTSLSPKRTNFRTPVGIDILLITEGRKNCTYRTIGNTPCNIKSLRRIGIKIESITSTSWTSRILPNLKKCMYNDCIDLIFLSYGEIFLFRQFGRKVPASNNEISINMRGTHLTDRSKTLMNRSSSCETISTANDLKWVAIQSRLFPVESRMYG